MRRRFENKGSQEEYLEEFSKIVEVGIFVLPRLQRHDWSSHWLNVLLVHLQLRLVDQEHVTYPRLLTPERTTDQWRSNRWTGQWRGQLWGNVPTPPLKFQQFHF